MKVLIVDDPAPYVTEQSSAELPKDVADKIREETNDNNMTKAKYIAGVITAALRQNLD